MQTPCRSKSAKVVLACAIERVIRISREAIETYVEARHAAQFGARPSDRSARTSSAQGWAISMASRAASLEKVLLEQRAQLEHRSRLSVRHRRHRTIMARIDLPRQDCWGGFTALAPPAGW